MYDNLNHIIHQVSFVLQPVPPPLEGSILNMQCTRDQCDINKPEKNAKMAGLCTDGTGHFKG